MADIAVENAVANGPMQRPDQHQDNFSVSSEENAFYRAQGSPVTLELPLHVNSADRSLVLSSQSTQFFDNDYMIRQLA